MNKNDCTYIEKLTELRLDFAHPNSQGKAYILLEGDSDVRLYRKLFNTNVCKIETLPGGKTKLEEGLIELQQLNNIVIGIRDADFMHLENKTVTTNHLFLTDLHDLEMSLISSNSAFCSVAYEFCTGSQEEHNPIRMSILNCISFIGYLRWYNELNDIRLNFDAVNFGDLYSHSSVTIDQDQYLNRLISRSPNAKEKDVNNINAGVAALGTGHDLLQLCNGHDYIKTLSAYITAMNGRGTSSDAIAAIFRVAYTFDDFTSTQLYSNIRQWAESLSINVYA